MKKIIILSIISIFLCLIYLTFSKNNIKHTEDDQIKIIVDIDTVIVSGKTFVTKAEDIKQNNIVELLHRFNASGFQAIYRNRYNEKGHLKPNITSLTGNWQEIILKNKSRAEEFVHFLKMEKGITNAYIERPLPFRPGVAPIDPEYSNQWHLRSLNYPAADINAEQAWAINKGRNDVIIAVCDGGVDYSHLDLDPGDRSRVISGYDSGSNDNDPMDDLPGSGLSFGGHGTHVAGIIGAISNNNKQVSGVMWNCKIMPIKMVGSGSLTITYPFGSTNWDFSTTAFPSDVADAIDYAVNNGARVINLSYGFDSMGALLNDVILRVPLLYSAILNAYNNNVVIVAAMGNEYQRGNPTQFPAAFREVIAVGSTRNSNPPSRSSFSSTGTHICISAPGDDILSTVRGGGTDVKSGTSMAAPVVSGVAGLIISQGMDRNFNLTNDDVRHILERTAVDIGVPGFDNETGHGIINAQNALELLDEPNRLFHYNSIGGTSVKTQTFSKWILLSNRWGLAAGTYLNVDQYKITKHVTFDVPFCSTPQVWMRERESNALSYANPNSGYPFSIITNVTNTGFDLEYVTYYVKYNSLGQTINTWIPRDPALTNVAYTAVGVPNFAANTLISGPTLACLSSVTSTINGLPSVSSIVWEPGPNMTIASGQNTTTCTFSTTASGNSWVKAHLITDCGNITLPQKNLWIGIPPAPEINSYTPFVWSTSFWPTPVKVYTVYAEDEIIFYDENTNTFGGLIESFSREWDIDAGSIPYSAYDYGPGGRMCFFHQPGTVRVRAKSSNSCGETEWSEPVFVDVIAQEYMLSLSPNPASGEVTVELKSGGNNTDLLSNENVWDLDVYDAMQSLKTKVSKIKNKSTVLNTSGWKDGVYVIRAIVGKKLVTGKLVVKH